MLRVSQLCCRHGVVPLFDNLDFSLDPGQWLHVRGDNGTGKTSLLRLLAGLSLPDAGEITWDNQQIHKLGTDYYCKVFYFGHQEAVKGDLSIRENIEFSCKLRNDYVEPKIAEALSLFGLDQYDDIPVRHLSAGQKRRIILAQIAACSVPLLILDEPFNALDVHTTQQVHSMLNEHLLRDGLIILASHQGVDLPPERMKEVQL